LPYDSDFIRCSAFSVTFSVTHTKLGNFGGKCCICCGCRVRTKPHGKYRRVMPEIKVVQTKRK